jgi:hypothetical protein
VRPSFGAAIYIAGSKTDVESCYIVPVMVSQHKYEFLNARLFDLGNTIPIPPKSRSPLHDGARGSTNGGKNLERARQGHVTGLQLAPVNRDVMYRYTIVTVNASVMALGHCRRLAVGTNHPVNPSKQTIHLICSKISTVSYRCNGDVASASFLAKARMWPGDVQSS